METEKPYVIGMDLGGTNSVCGIVDARGNILCTDSVKTQQYPNIEDYIQAVCNILMPMIEKVGGIEKIKGFGIGAPNGNYYNGTIEHAPNLPWKGIVPMANMFKTMIENRSNGEILVEIYPNDSLGYIYDYGRALKEGTVDAWIGSGAVKLNTVAYWSPTLTDASLEDIRVLTETDAFIKRLEEECAGNGYLSLGIFPAQYRVLTSNDAISSIDDFKAIKMRSYMEQSLEKVYWDAMGVSVTSCDIHELYGALETDTVNAQSNTLPVIVSNRLYEQQAYSMDLRHMVYYDGLFMGKCFYDELDGRLQEVIDQVAADIRLYARDMYQAEHSRCESVIVKAGIKELPVDDELRNQVKAVAAPYLEKALRESVGDEDVDLVVDGLREIAAARALLPEKEGDGDG